MQSPKTTRSRASNGKRRSLGRVENHTPRRAVTSGTARAAKMSSTGRRTVKPMTPVPTSPTVGNKGSERPVENPERSLKRRPLAMAKQRARVFRSPDKDDQREHAENAQREADLDRENTIVDRDPDEPGPEQLARAAAETEKALKEFERQGGGDSTLSRYFREMAGHRVLTPQEEVAAAKEVEALEIGYWVALFSYVPAFETVA